jgi:hypothetical protein
MTRLPGSARSGAACRAVVGASDADDDASTAISMNVNDRTMASHFF